MKITFPTCIWCGTTIGVFKCRECGYFSCLDCKVYSNREDKCTHRKYDPAENDNWNDYGSLRG